MAFSPDGHTLVGVDYSGAVQLWNVADPAHPRTLSQPQTSDEFVNSVAFSPDGHTLASIDVLDVARLWDVADPAHPRPLGQIFGRAPVSLVAFSLRGHIVASASPDGAIHLWDLTDPAHPRPLGQPQTASGVSVGSLAFSPSGRTMASGSGVANSINTANGSGGAVQLWDVTDPAHSRLLDQSQTGNELVVSLAFSPDGHTLASNDYGGTVQLWDVTDPAHLRPLDQPPTGGASAVDSVAFSRDGHTLATGSLDGTIRLWNLNVQYAIQRICATAGGLTLRQWNQYIPQLRYQPSCIH